MSMSTSAPHLFDQVSDSPPLLYIRAQAHLTPSRSRSSLFQKHRHQSPALSRACSSESLTSCPCSPSSQSEHEASPTVSRGLRDDHCGKRRASRSRCSRSGPNSPSGPYAMRPISRCDSVLSSSSSQTMSPLLRTMAAFTFPDTSPSSSRSLTFEDDEPLPLPQFTDDSSTSPTKAMTKPLAMRRRTPPTSSYFARGAPTAFPLCSNTSCNEVSALHLHDALEHKNTVVFDCRFPFEYAAGSVLGALNTPLIANVETLLFRDGQPLYTPDTVILFYCEFSSQRAPRLWRHIRHVDAAMNPDGCLAYPEMYVVHGGFKAIYATARDLCTGFHLAMNEPRHASELSVWTNRLTIDQRLSRTSRSKPMRPAPLNLNQSSTL
eukprot:m.268884 g.268884  ORF g.268884 m.268884 type:complete len:378 (-) comp15663_c2_seq1:516-1649(-)